VKGYPTGATVARVALLDDDTLADALTRLAWERDGDEIVKTVRRADFAAAMEFVNEVARLAEAANHHPDVDIRWNTVTLRLSTHSEGGLTEKDISLAGAIDALG
jgi:4a-hydroxytetrahydrobiopterin dehydratase